MIHINSGRPHVRLDGLIHLSPQFSYLQELLFSSYLIFIASGWRCLSPDWSVYSLIYAVNLNHCLLLCLSLQDLKKPFDKAWRDYESRLWVMITQNYLTHTECVYMHTSIFVIICFVVICSGFCPCKYHHYGFRNLETFLSRFWQTWICLLENFE